MRNKLFVALIALLISLIASGQNLPYQINIVVNSSPSEVSFEIAVFGGNKKAIEYEACCAALRAVLFEGINGTPFNKPLLSVGEKTSKELYPEYFNMLYGVRYPDFVYNLTAISKFKKGVNKSTVYRVTVKALSLRKDLEKNRIKKNIGL